MRPLWGWAILSQGWPTKVKMPTIIVPPAVDSNSYATREDANAYHATHLYADQWDAASQDSQERSLIMATRLIDAVYARAHGEWPARDTLQPARWMKEATAELARQLLESNRTADNDVAKQGIQKIVAGPVELTFDLRAIAAAERLESVIPDAVRLLMDPTWYRCNQAPIFEVYPCR